MSIKSHLEKAEESIRQALINALAEGEDDYLTELFEQLNSVSNLKKKIDNTIRFSDNTDDYYDRLNEFNVKPGKDLDSLDNVLEFPKYNFDNSPYPTGFSNDIITFGDTDKSEKT